MSSWIPEAVRRQVAERAQFRCEYCRIRETDTHLGCEVDHVTSEKHGGKTDVANLAYACFYCNRHKGSDIATLVPGTQNLVRLFNPRTDRWAEHFQIVATSVEGSSDVGRATAKLLRFNLPERILEREALMVSGHWP